MALAIRCCGLTKRYGSRAVVDGLDLEVGEGERFGFLGANGAGKTTTIRMLLGLVRPCSGQAWVLGSPVPCPDRLPEIGAMVEEPAFYPWLSGRANLAIVGDEGGRLAAGAVEEALAQAGLGPVADRKVKTYSQGMRQRLGLAVALLRRPRLVLLDEPANGMDPAGIHVLRDLLRDLSDAGATVFLSSHLLGEVEAVCHRVAVIDAGRLVSVAAVDQLGTTAPRVRVTLELATQAWAAEAARARAALARWEVTSDGPGQLLVVGAGGREVNEALALAGVIAAGITVERPSLEARFLALTQGGPAGAPVAS